MRLNYIDNFQRTWVAVAVGGVSLGTGIYKSVHGAQQAKHAQRDIENAKTPGYIPNPAINQYYQNALSRYNTNPYNSAMYQVSKENADKSLGTGIGALQDRRSGLAGIGSLTAGYNNALQKAGVQSEGMRNQEFGMLGKAAAMKAGEDRTAFQYNELMPYNKKISLYQAQGIGGVNLENSGLQDINQGINNVGIGLYNNYSNRQNTGSRSSAMYESNSYGTGGPQLF